MNRVRVNVGLWLLLCAAAAILAGPSLAQESIPDSIPGSSQRSLQDLDADRDTVVAIEVEGLVFHDPDRVAELLGFEVGQPIPLSTTEAQRQLNLDFGILVQPQGLTYEEVEGGVIVHLVLIESPVDLEPQFIGNVKFNVKRLREWALLDDRVEVYIAEIDKIKDRLTAAYKRQGYHFVEVDHVVGGEGLQRREIIFQIREGPKVYVKSVKIIGNEAFPDEGILLWRKSLKKSANLGTSGRGLFAWLGHRYVEDVLEADRLAIVTRYRESGYLDAVVDAELEFTEDRAGVYVKFVVDEGPVYTVGSVGIKAFEIERVDVIPGGRAEDQTREVDLIIPEDELLALLELVPGGPFESSRIQVDRGRLLDRYGRNGHIDAASFEGESGTAGWDFLGLDAVRDYEKKRVYVTYKIQQGRPFYLQYLEVNGNDNTKDHVIRQRFGQLPGELVDGTKVREGLRRVLRTGYFDDSFARGSHPPPSVRYRTVEGSPDLVDIVVNVEEGRTINANLSGGVASDQGLVGIVSLTVNNFDAQRLPRTFFGMFGELYRKEAFTGDGETFGIDLSPGSRVNYSRIFYQHPDIFRRYFDPVGFIAEFQLRDRIFRSHEEAREFARLAITRAFGQGDWQASVGVRWQELRISGLDPDPIPLSLIRSDGNETFVGVTASLSVNKLDNPRLPRSGYSGRWTNTLYGEALGSDNNLWKTEVSFDRYFHLNDDPNDAAQGIYVGLGSGLAVPFDGARGTVNYGERFFFGGARIGRGFRFRGIGPFDGDFPSGGETYARSTVEYRFPLYTQSVPGTSLRREVFRGSLFVDTVVLNPKAYELDLSEARISAGFALGLIEPFPVTFSFGFPIRSEEQDERQVFAFSLTFR